MKFRWTRTIYCKILYGRRKIKDNKLITIRKNKDLRKWSIWGLKINYRILVNYKWFSNKILINISQDRKIEKVDNWLQKEKLMLIVSCFLIFLELAERVATEEEKNE